VHLRLHQLTLCRAQRHHLRDARRTVVADLLFVHNGHLEHGGGQPAQ
jgi:hypothetical protein